MKVSWFDGVVYCVNTSVVIKELVVDSHVVIKEVELSISGLLHVHLRHPVVGKIQGNVTTIRDQSMQLLQLPRMNLPGTLAPLQSFKGGVLAEHGCARHGMDMTSLAVTRVH